MKGSTVQDVLERRLIVNHENYKDYIERIEYNAPKIHKLTRNAVICCGGDGAFTDVIQNLNTRKNIANQILERLKKKLQKAYWNCHVARYNKRAERTELTSFTYENGNVKIVEHDRDNIEMNTFSPEMKDVFQKYVMGFYLSNTEQKTKIIQEFFKEVTELYSGVAGGKAVIGKIDKNGFKWIVKSQTPHVQNFTTYSNTWMPTKIETVATSEYSWTSENWTTILELTFECDNKEILFILAHAEIDIWDAKYAYFRLVVDSTEIPASYMMLGRVDGSNSASFFGCYSTNSVLIVEKGQHTLKLQLASYITDKIVAARSRRLTIQKGFYQGGAS